MCVVYACSLSLLFSLSPSLSLSTTPPQKMAVNYYNIYI